MGDIFRKVNICGLTTTGRKLGCVRNVNVLVDTGATSTVISKSLAKRVGGRYLKGFEARIEDRKVPVKLTAITLQSPKCGIQAMAVAVDDQLVTRAGKNVEAILGHDYLEKERAGLRYLQEGDEIACNATELRGVPTLRSASTRKTKKTSPKKRSKRK